ncbi:MAG: hypothetical protein ACYCZJ_14805 [Sulfuriferula sp.]
MPIQDFSGKCFVAFTDISGFKAMMKDGERAARAIDALYSAGFDILSRSPNVNGFFISDCGVLFSRNNDQKEQLERLLEVVRALNQQVLQQDIMLTTSIAWGDFSYHNRIEFTGINKQPIYGNAYVSAFLDNETGIPRLQPGQCRIIKQGVPTEVFYSVTQHSLIESAKAHCYYYWMVENAEEIPEFKRRYKDSYNLKYAGMLNAIKRHN